MKNYRDHYFLRAKQEEYPARSVYKLQEIEKRFHIFSAGQKVLDLGAAPGSWSLYAAKKIKDGKVLSVDLQTTETSFPANIEYIQQDVFSDSEELQALLDKYIPFDVIISDMAPKTSGIKFSDQAFSLELCERAFELARKHLKVKGHFVVKIFEGPDVRGYVDSLRPFFSSVKIFKPKSSRPESKETFIIGLEFSGDKSE